MLSKKQLQIKNEEIIPDIIGKPFNNPFEIFIFNIKEKIIKFNLFDKSIIENSELINYNNSSSSYCNGNNYLYISGGENKNLEIINKLWKIDLKNNIINEPIQIPPKKNHSMIFIPDNYIFIVGGNDKKTFYLDEQNLQISEWGDLNEERLEPALIRISNILYCFDKISSDTFSIEQTNLKDEKYEWKLIKPIIGPSLKNQKFNNKFFGLTKIDENNIIICGGNIDDSDEGNKNINNLRYNLSNNSIESSEITYNNYKLKEKTFLIYNKDIEYIFPDFNRENPEIILFFKNKQIFEKIIFAKKQKNNASIEYIFPNSIFNLYKQENNNIINNKDNNLINKVQNKNNEDTKSNNNLVEKNSSNNSTKNKITNKLKRPNSFRNYFSNYNNNLFIPNFHCNIDDPSNELNIIKRKRMYKNFYPLNKKKGKQFPEELKFNSYELISDDNQNYDEIIPSKENENKNGNFNLEGIIVGLKNKKEIKVNNMKKEEYILKGKIPGINVEKQKINLNNSEIKNPEINLNNNINKEIVNEIKSSFNIKIPQNEINKNINNIETSKNNNTQINTNINSNKLNENKINVQNLETPLEIKIPSGINDINKSNDIKELDNKSINNSKINNPKINNHLKSPSIKYEFKNGRIFKGIDLNDEILRENKKNINKFRNSSYEVKGKRRIPSKNNYKYNGIIKGIKANISKDKQNINPPIKTLENLKQDELKISKDKNSINKSKNNNIPLLDNNSKNPEKNAQIIPSSIEINNNIKLNQLENNKNNIQEDINNKNIPLIQTPNINVIQNKSIKSNRTDKNSFKRSSKSSSSAKNIDKKSEKIKVYKTDDNKNANKQSVLTFEQLKIISNDNDGINSNIEQKDIIFEKPKDEKKENMPNTEIYKPKIGEDNKINNIVVNNIFLDNGYASKVFSQNTNLKKKTKELPLVGQKKNDFEISKSEKVGKFDIKNIDINNLKSTYVGINGIKFGDRINE